MNKIPSMPEVPLRGLQEEHPTRSSRENLVKPGEPKLFWTLADITDGLASDGSRDHRMVLPKATLEAGKGQSQHRIVLAQGKTKCCQPVTREANQEPAHSNLSGYSKAQSLQACQEELEFLKLKLRYMQNDIELKKQHISSAKSARLTDGSKFDKQDQNGRNSLGKSVSVCERVYASLDDSSRQNSKLQHSIVSATKWLALPASRQHAPTPTYVTDSYYCHQVRCGVPQKFVTTGKEQQVPSTASVTGNIHQVRCAVPQAFVTTGSRTLEANNSNSKSYTWCANVLPKPESLMSQPSRHSASVAKYSAHEKSGKGSSVSNSNLVPFQQTQKVPGHTEHTINQYHSTSKNIASCEFQMKNLYTNISTNVDPAASVFERLGSQNISETQRPVVLSPDKRHVVYSLKTSPKVTAFTCGIQSVSSPVTDVSAVSEVPLVCSTQSVPSAKDVSSCAASGSNAHYQNSRHKLQTSSSFSKYKLIRNSSSSPPDKRHPSVTHPADCLVLPSCSNNSFLEIPSSSVSPVKATVLVRRGAPASLLNLRSSSSKTLAAAKLVSKYKLKRLSPTSVSVAPPVWCYSRQQIKRTALELGQHKLDRRLVFVSSSTPQLSAKKSVMDTSRSQISLPSKVHKLDRRPLSVQQYQATRTQQTSNRSKLKIDKRMKSCNVIKEFSDSQDSLTSLNRIFGAESCNLKSSPAQIIRNKEHKPYWISHLPDSYVARKEVAKSKKSFSKYSWKKTSLKQSNSLPVLTSTQNSRFKWSRPQVQAQNGSWQQLRHKLQLLLNKKHRNSRFKFYKYPYSMAIPNKSGILGQEEITYNVTRNDGSGYRSGSQRTARRVSTSLKKTVAGANSLSVISSPQSLSRQNMKLISLGGIHFNVDRSGKKLCRTEPAAPGTRKISTSCSDSCVINFANRAIHRSIAITAAKYRKNNQKRKAKTPHCIFFGRFGKCNRGDKCPYIHDPEKVAVCTRFLRGKCETEGCPFSHKASKNKMPVCLFFLRGLCSRDNCPYLHVKVNPDAPVCKDFRNGYCVLGEKCKKIHSHVCPSFAMTGLCSRLGSCTMLHRTSRREQEGPLLQQAKPLADSSKQLTAANKPVERQKCGTLQAKRGKSVLTSTSAALTAQPSFISLETSPAACFISLEDSQPGGISDSKDCQPGGISDSKDSQGKPLFATISDSVTHPTSQGGNKETVLSIRPSFLAKKFV